MSAAGAQDVCSGFRVGVTGGNRGREISLQIDHLLTRKSSLLRIEPRLLDGQHGSDGLFILALSYRGVRFSHRGFGVTRHL